MTSVPSDRKTRISPGVTRFDSATAQTLLTNEAFGFAGAGWIAFAGSGADGAADFVSADRSQATSASSETTTMTGIRVFMSFFLTE